MGRAVPDDLSRYQVCVSASIFILLYLPGYDISENIILIVSYNNFLTNLKCFVCTKVVLHVEVRVAGVGK